MLQETLISNKERKSWEITNSGNNKTKTLYEITKTLTFDTSENILLTATSHKELPDIFANFLVDSHQN